jgi:hypothetical protein
MATEKRNKSGATGEANDRLHSIGDQASATVRQAAEVLEQELSSGLEETRRLQRRFTEHGRLEPGDLSEVVARVRSNAHGLIDTAAARFDEMAADDVQDLLGRFTKDAHEAFDSLMDLVDSSPVLINRLLGRAEANASTQGETGATNPSSSGEAGRATDGAAGSATTRKATSRKATPRKATPRKATPRGTPSEG